MISGNCTINIGGHAERAAIQEISEIRRMAAGLSNGETLKLHFGYCRASLSWLQHDSVFKVSNPNYDSEELDEICRGITGDPAGNKEVYVIAERKAGKTYWTLINFSDWHVSMSDDLEALHIHPLDMLDATPR